MSISIQQAPLTASVVVGGIVDVPINIYSTIVNEFQPNTVLGLSSNRARLSLDGTTWGAWGAGINIGTVFNASTLVHMQVRSLDSNTDGYDDLDPDHNMEVLLSGLLIVPQSAIAVIGGVYGTCPIIVTSTGTIANKNPLSVSYVDMYCSPYGSVTAQAAVGSAAGMAEIYATIAGAAAQKNPAAGTVATTTTPTGTVTSNAASGDPANTTGFTNILRHNGAVYFDVVRKGIYSHVVKDSVNNGITVKRVSSNVAINPNANLGLTNDGIPRENRFYIDGLTNGTTYTFKLDYNGEAVANSEFSVTPSASARTNISGRHYPAPYTFNSVGIDHLATTAPPDGELGDPVASNYNLTFTRLNAESLTPFVQVLTLGQAIASNATITTTHPAPVEYDGEYFQQIYGNEVYVDIS